MLIQKEHITEKTHGIVGNAGQTCEGNPGTIKVLMYHRIVETSSSDKMHPWWVSIRDFRQQLELLDRWGFTAITLNDYRLFLNDRLNLPRKPVVITFDDGYEDTYRVAYPTLEEFGMKAVFFVLGERKVKTNYWDVKHGVPEVRLMSGQQIIELHENGYEIGSHSMSHVRLPFVSEDKAWEEISHSRMLLEILLNAPVLSFSYPYGLSNKSTERMVKDAGFQIACSGQSGPPRFGKNLTEVRRIPILSTTGKLGFAARMLMPYQHFDWVRSKVSRAIYGPYGMLDTAEGGRPTKGSSPFRSPQNGSPSKTKSQTIS